MPLPTSNKAIIAAAGSGKTERLVSEALSVASERVLITTYTNENLHQIEERIVAERGHIPQNITIMSWYRFLIDQCARPYQTFMFDLSGELRSLNFQTSSAPRFAKRSTLRYYIDRHGDMYADAVSDFVCLVNSAAGGLVLQRLETIFEYIFVDEVQDLVGYDLDVLDLLFASALQVTVAGDPRQFILQTNRNSKNKPLRGIGFLTWLEKRATSCSTEMLNVSYRCNQRICEWADRLFLGSGLDPTASLQEGSAANDGVHLLTRAEAEAYIDQWQPAILRYDRNSDCFGRVGMNIGVAKGRTFDHVIVFAPKPMIDYFHHQDPTRLKQPEKVYVAVTRARFSVAFVPQH